MSIKKSTFSGFSFMTTLVAIAVAVVISIFIFNVVLGNAANFDAEGHPIPGNYLGMMHAGGYIVPILMSIVLIVFTFSIERIISLSNAKGKGAADVLLKNVKDALSNKEYSTALELCDKQEGSLGNVVRAGIEKLQIVEKDKAMSGEEKITAVQKELEESISLELPMLSKNLSIISTCASISTLFGLIGTVLGMIKSFSAMANAGAPDTAALSVGISEALINTALGVFGSVLAIISYNYFSTRIDTITHSMDEAGYSILHSLKKA
jgi:biopolymer transport protein ExbB